MAVRVDVAGHRFEPDSVVVIDTNVLVLVFGDHYSRADEKERAVQFARALDDLELSGSRGVLLDTTLSEFVHAMERKAAERWFQEFGKARRNRGSIRKLFREDSESYTLALQRIASVVQILEARFSPAQVPRLTPSRAVNFIKLMAEYVADFNDIRISDYCRTKRADLMTDDVDMADIGGNFNVITVART